MAETILTNVKVRNRTDISANWSTANPVLLSGEIGVATDAGTGILNNTNTPLMKIGDGTSKWKDLKWVGAANGVAGANTDVSTKAKYITLTNGVSVVYTYGNIKLSFKWPAKNAKCTVSNSAIHANHAVTDIVFSTNPQAITGTTTWTTDEGSLTLEGSTPAVEVSGYVCLTYCDGEI